MCISVDQDTQYNYILLDCGRIPAKLQLVQQVVYPPRNFETCVVPIFRDLETKIFSFNAVHLGKSLETKISRVNTTHHQGKSGPIKAW